MNKIRYKKYYLYNTKKLLIEEKLYRQSQKVNKNAKRLVLKMY